MNAPEEPRPWPRKKWWAAVFAVFMVQVAAVLLLSDRAPLSARESPRAAIQLVPELARDARFAPLLELHDPAVFALANRHGFSGHSWLRDLPAEHELLDWVEPNAWLTNRVDVLGQTFVEFSHSQSLPSTTLARAIPPPQDSGPRAENFLPTKSEWRLPPGWSFVSPVALPSWTNATVLNRTRISLTVDAKGEVISAVIAPPLPQGNDMMNRSGNPDADRKALELARGLQLKRVHPLEDVNWVMVDVLWHTVPEQKP